MSGPGNRWGVALVAAQFALMALLATLAVAGLAGGDTLDAARLGGLLAAAAAAALGAWCLAANPPGNFNIRPTPRPDGRLVTTGPYRWIRHPMYTTVLLAGLAAVAMALPGGRLPALATWAALAAVLATKARLEERWMTQLHPAYADYAARTRRFVPGLI